MTTQTKEKTTRAVAIATQERKITLTFDDVKEYLCPRASHPEIALFLKTCQSLGLNPFARDCYLVKYTDEEAASIIIAIDAFLKAAETCLNYAGHEAGVILKKENSHLDFREAARILNVRLEYAGIQCAEDKPCIESFFGSYKTEEMYRNE